MRIFISADIEGVTGITTWDEAANMPDYESKKRMTEEVRIACQTALDHGATEVVVKDAHGDGKNLLVDGLPQAIKLISGWSGHPYSMVEGLDDTFDGVIFIGYHSNGLSNTSPLAHTLCPHKIKGLYLNDHPASEFTLFSNVANMLGVPIIAVTGDGGVIREVQQSDACIETVAVQEGFGGGMVSIHPRMTLERIERAIKLGMEKIDKRTKTTLPTVFNLKIIFNRHQDAYKYSFYPQVKQIDEYTLSLTTDNYMDILSFLLFI